MAKIEYSEEHIASLQSCLDGWNNNVPDTYNPESLKLYNQKRKLITVELEKEIKFCKAQKKQPVGLDTNEN